MAGKDLRGVCMCIDLVFSSSIDATNCLFTESDALRSDFFLPELLLINQTRFGVVIFKVNIVIYICEF